MTSTPRIEREGRLLHQHEVPDVPQPETRHLSDNAALRDRQYSILQHIQETLDNPQTRDTFFRRLFGLFDGNNGQTFLDRLRAFFHGHNTTTTQPISQLPAQQLPNVPVPPLQQLPNVPTPPTAEVTDQVRKAFEDAVRAIPLPEGVTITTCTPEVVIISYKNNTENVWLTQPGNVDSIRTALPTMARRLVSRVDGTPPPAEERPTPNPESPQPNPEESQKQFEEQARNATLLPYVTIARIEGRSVVLTCQGEEETVTVPANGDVTQMVTDGVRVIRYNVDRRIDAARGTLTLPDGMTVEAAETPPYWQLRYRDQTQQVDVFAVPLRQLAEHAQTVAAQFKQRIDTPENPQPTPEQPQEEFEKQARAATLLPYVTIARIEGRTVTLACLGEEQVVDVPANADVTQVITDNVRVLRYNTDRRIDALRTTLALPEGMTAEAAETPPYWQLRYNNQTQDVDVFAVPLTQLTEYTQKAAAEFKQRVDTPRQDTPPQQETPTQEPTPETPAEFRAKVDAATLLPYVTVARIEGRVVTLACLGEERPVDVAVGADVTQVITDNVRVLRYATDRRIDALRTTLALPEGMTAEAAETPPYWQLRYRDQTQQVDVFAVPLTQLVESTQKTATEFKQRIDKSQNTPPQNPPENRETDPRARIDALRTEIAALAENRGIDADGIDAHVAAIREKITAVNAAIAAVRTAEGGRFRPRWEGRSVMARPTLLVNYIGNDTTGQVEMKEVALVSVPEDYAKVRRTRDLTAQAILDTPASSGIGEKTEELLAAMGRQTSGDYTFEPVPAGGPTQFKYRIVRRVGGTTETWYVSRPSLSERRYPESLILWKANADGTCDRRTQALIGDDHILEFGRADRTEADVKANRQGELNSVRMAANWTRTFENYRRIANFSRQSEERDEAGMLPRDGRPGFDLPRNRPVSTLQLMGFQYDTAFEHTRPDYQRLLQTMSRQGYQMVPMSAYSGDVARDPAQILEEAIQASLALGITDMYLNVSCHGSASGRFAFPRRAKPEAEGGGPDFADCWTLTHTQIMGILGRYPTMHLTLNSTSCYGAWGADASTDPADRERMPFRVMQDRPGAAEGRYTAFTQTIPQSYTISGGTYDRLLDYYMAQGKPYGEAHMLADAGAQVHTGQNAGVRRSSTTDNRYTETARGPNTPVYQGEQSV